ncbi:MAG: glycerophosphodiester phosphodiesterase [Thiotrichales bacterium SG8_50]|nr:MAG: glycerophosphodiester phosphodiesterase [Thiotrichales bacterium SG8_50]
MATIRTPIVIAHRGASGYLPEHTLAAYALAIFQGADFVEPDLVASRDGSLIARHDNLLNLSTDVAQRPEFAERRTTKTVDGVEVTGWFSEDFTLDEIRTLRATERIPETRPSNTRFDGQFQIPSFEEILELIASMSRIVGRPIGVYPETKHPSYFAQLGLAMEPSLVKTLADYGYLNREARAFIQSFEVGNLRELRQLTDLPLVQLLWREGQPYDVTLAGGSLTYDAMATPAGLATIAEYADAVGPEKNHFLIPLDADGRLDGANTTSFVADAHAAGLLVHPYTFRAENAMLPTNLRSFGKPDDHGALLEELSIFLAAGIDGFFIDQPEIGAQARDAASTA